MKKLQSLLALLLIAALCCALFTACAASGDKPADADKQTGTDAPPSGGEDASSGEPDTSGTPQEDSDEIVEINYIFYDFSSAGADHGERIEAALNQITEAELGIHVNMTFIAPGDWAAKAGMMVASGETVDLMVMCPPLMSLNSMYNNGQVMDITELLPEYAPDAYKLVGDYMGDYTLEGHYYGIPALRNYCTNGYLLMDKAVLEELGLLEKAQNMRSWSEYEEIMAAVTENYGGEGYYANSNGIADLVDGIAGMDFSQVVRTKFSDSCGVVLCDADGKVTLKQDSDSFKASRALVADWFEKGYIYPDALLGTVMQDDLWKQGVVFSGPQNAEYGVEVSKSVSFGKEIIATMVYQGTISSARWGQVVPISAEEPEAALRFLNACYTNSEIVNLLYRGIEGEDYTVVDDQISYAEDAHYQQTACFFGCEFLSTPLYGNGADFYEKVREINATAEVSPFMGFSLNTSELDLVISQINAVRDQYKITINCGGYTEALGQEYVAKLEAAGVNDYLAEVQAQLDAFLASK